MILRGASKIASVGLGDGLSLRGQSGHDLDADVVVACDCFRTEGATRTPWATNACASTKAGLDPPEARVAPLANCTFVALRASVKSGSREKSERRSNHAHEVDDAEACRGGHDGRFWLAGLREPAAAVLHPVCFASMAAAGDADAPPCQCGRAGASV
jgi:hypothetical protein